MFRPKIRPSSGSGRGRRTRSRGRRGRRRRPRPAAHRVVSDITARAAFGGRLRVSYAMSHSTFLHTSSERSALFALPQREADLLRHYTPERRAPAEHRVPAASPRPRGSRGHREAPDHRCGYIPACAGKPSGAASRNAPDKVHPRVCGEAVALHERTITAAGPSPRGRGILVEAKCLSRVDPSAFLAVCPVGPDRRGEIPDCRAAGPFKGPSGRGPLPQPPVERHGRGSTAGAVSRHDRPVRTSRPPRPRLIRDAPFLEAGRRGDRPAAGPSQPAGSPNQVAVVRVLDRFPALVEI